MSCEVTTRTMNENTIFHFGKRIVTFVSGVFAFVVASNIAATIVGITSRRKLQIFKIHTVNDYDAAMAKIAEIQAYEETLELYPGCQTTVLTHGHKVEQAIVLMHGMTNCPLQFVKFGKLLYERGYNVLLPRMPRNGYANLDTNALTYITAEELRDCSATAVDIAHGLGEHVSYGGLSVGGTMAAWVAQYRGDVDRAILIAPAFTINRHFDVMVSRITMYLFYLLPNIMTRHLRRHHGSPHGYYGFATRGLAEMMRLGFTVYNAALRHKPAVKSVLVVSNAADPAMNNNITRKLVDRWQKNGLNYCEHYQFDANYHLIHDIIEPDNPQQHIALTYPVLLDLITQNQNAEP